MLNVPYMISTAMCIICMNYQEAVQATGAISVGLTVLILPCCVHLY